MNEAEAARLLDTDPDNAPDVFQETNGKWIARVRGRYLSRSEIRIELEHAQDDRVPHLRGALHLIEQAVKANAERLGFGRATATKKTDTARTRGVNRDSDRKDDRRGRLGFDDDNPNASRLSNVRDERREEDDDSRRLRSRTSDNRNKAAPAKDRQRRKSSVQSAAKKTALKKKRR